MRKLAVPPTSPLLDLAARNREALATHTAELHAVAATMRELDAASHEIARGAERVSVAAENTVEQARVGERSTAGFVQGLERIHENAATVHEALSNLSAQMEGIGNAVLVIDELSDRTDLLALNAALEGARAGDAGRGILVIAGELRRLAESVTARTSGIRELIDQIKETTSVALQASERNRDVAIDGEELALAATVSLKRIVGSVEETFAAAREIRIATLQQQEATQAALVATTKMTEATSSLESIAEELVEAAES